MTAIDAFLSHFTDPVLRAPMVGSMLMCFSAALMGVIVFLKKQSLIGEALSHAAYPGVVLGATLMGLLLGDTTNHDWIGILILAAAFLTALLGMKLIGLLERRLKVNSDAALCFVLSFFFGCGILLASHIQVPFSNLFRAVQIYFYGQAATMTDIHVLLYGVLACVIMGTLFYFSSEFKIWIFDPTYAHVLGIDVKRLEWIFLLLVAISIVMGIRSVGVVLMSAMLIGPAVAARQCTNRLKPLFILAVCFALFSASFGTFLASEVSDSLMQKYPGTKMSLPTGPMIVLISSAICLICLFFAPQKGMVIRLFRIFLFRSRCLKENLLKTLWRQGPKSFRALQNHLFVPFWQMKWELYLLKKEGFVNFNEGVYALTPEGFKRGSHIVRLHRLWELYLSEHLGVGAERVHAGAEEMEHILTPELEKELTLLLNNPVQDPHHQPIPKADG